MPLKLGLLNTKSGCGAANTAVEDKQQTMIVFLILRMPLPLFIIIIGSRIVKTLAPISI
jgi:hypothetical protein